MEAIIARPRKTKELTKLKAARARRIRQKRRVSEIVIGYAL
jgi:hypothetical protein